MDEIEDFLWRLSRQLFNMVGGQMMQSPEPYVEVSEHDEGVVLAAEAPGVRPEDLRVRVSDHGIRISIVENGIITYSRTYETGKISQDDAEITCKNGVLEVKVPYKRTFF
ncbi:MAG: hypothetical protein GF416_01810 [Candidatus Altiarchaeales archaeon]|nr:hypothetical protein [Candidatus Altiarchaeales archaeon]MBD3415852.1 hypothetical protein [Candidatus Altiarchaeales archaeon]